MTAILSLSPLTPAPFDPSATGQRLALAETGLNYTQESTNLVDQDSAWMLDNDLHSAEYLRDLPSIHEYQPDALMLNTLNNTERFTSWAWQMLCATVADLFPWNRQPLTEATRSRLSKRLHLHATLVNATAHYQTFQLATLCDCIITKNVTEAENKRVWADLIIRQISANRCLQSSVLSCMFHEHMGLSWEMSEARFEHLTFIIPEKLGHPKLVADAFASMHGKGTLPARKRAQILRKLERRIKLTEDWAKESCGRLRQLKTNLPMVSRSVTYLRDMHDPHAHNNNTGTEADPICLGDSPLARARLLQLQTLNIRRRVRTTTMAQRRQHRAEHGNDTVRELSPTRRPDREPMVWNVPEESEDGSGTEDPPGPHSGIPNGESHVQSQQSPSHLDNQGGIDTTGSNMSKEKSTSAGPDPDLDLVVWDEAEEAAESAPSLPTDNMSNGDYSAPGTSPRPGPSSRQDEPIAGPSAPEERPGNRRTRTDSTDEARVAKVARRAESSSPEVTWDGVPGAVKWSGPREQVSEEEVEWEEGFVEEELDFDETIELPSSDDEE